MAYSDRDKQDALWQARDGISTFTKAMEKLYMDFGVIGSEKLWDEGLTLWSEFTKIDESELQARLLKRRKGD